MPSTASFSVLLPPRVLAVAAILLGASYAMARTMHPAEFLGVLVASLQFAGAIAIWRHGARMMWPVLAGILALAAGLVLPRIAPAIGAAARLAVYASLLRLFAASLRCGREPVVTRLARRIHPALSPARTAYTRSVTWLWTGVFAAQVALWTLLLAAAPFGAKPWFAAWADLPVLVAVFAGEMAVRAIRFRGQPHGSVGDMLRAARRV